MIRRVKLTRATGLLILSMACVGLSLFLMAQKDSSSAVIRVNSTLVLVPVSVTDANGQAVRDLTAADFRLEDEGREQTTTLLGEPGKTAIELAILFDVSGSIHDRFQFEQQVAAQFLKVVLKPNDSVSVFSIGMTPKLVQPRTRDNAAAMNGLLRIQPTKEATAFYDAVADAAQYLRKTAQPGTRRVQVVISDGEDNNSERYRLGETMREMQRADCIFYSINPGGPSIRLNKISLKGQEGMEALATHTGGQAFLPDKAADLEAVFRQIAAELQAQYLLGFYVSHPRADGGFRRISVRVPKQPELRVRARQGYYAPTAP
ncbi:MAG: VWA domain-containing protein [Acidobacteria bacterium]|nr:VWA domain-containing protein [Acidobacteriota bacterium]MBI3657559.1 VWA domain-containing protein [Acidobacteriota bacterium]